MSYKRYDGFYGNGLQQKIDNNLITCPFCGESPNWLLDLQTGFAKSNVTCMCEKCGAKLYTESNGFGWDDNLRVVDVGSKNQNGLALNASYHIKTLSNLGKNTVISDNNNSDFFKATAPNNSAIPTSITTTAIANKNKCVVAIIAFVVTFIIVLSIILGSRSCSSSITYLTYENYIEIQNGMSYSEVVEILDGHQGKLDTESGYGGYTLRYYTWTNSSATRCIVVGFENNRVCAKSQFGLT